MQLEQNIDIINAKGTCSTFGGPHDTGMKMGEGVSIYLPGEKDPYSLFEPGNSRLGHRLNPDAYYCAMRWDYSKHPRLLLKHSVVRVTNAKTGNAVFCHPADWGPNAATHRLIDLSPGAARVLGVRTDEEVWVIGLYDAANL